jgi:spermidine synthase
MSIISLLTLALGAYGVLAQVIFMSKLSYVFYGNELSLGIILFSWLFITGLGTLLSTRSIRTLGEKATMLVLAGLVIVSTLLLPAIFYMLSFARTFAGFLPGELVSLSFIFIVSVSALLIHACSQGALFCCLCHLQRHEKRAATSSLGGLVNNVYILESLGAFLGGLYYAIIGRLVLTPTANIFLLNALACLMLFMFLRQKKMGRVGAVVLAIIFVHIAGSLFSPAIEKLFLKNIYRPLPVTGNINTRYGQTTFIQQSEEDIALFRDGVIEDETGNEEASEELAYYGLLQRDQMPKQVLILGGGYVSLPVRFADMKDTKLTIVQPDKKLLKRLMSSTGFIPQQSDQAIDIIYNDVGTFIKKCGQKFDYIISASPPPYTLGLNRFYTEEFFRDIKNVLAPSGVFCFSVPSSENLINDELAAFLSSINNTARSVFEDVVIIPGSTNIFILTNTPNSLTLDTSRLVQRAAALPFTPAFVNSAYIPYRVSEERVRYLKERIASSSFTAVNTVLHPITFYFDFILWSSKTSDVLKKTLHFLHVLPFGVTLIVLVILLFAISALMTRQKRSDRATFFAITSLGLTEISLEIILLLTYQAMFGYVYTTIALLIACYMLGLVAGSLWGNRPVSADTKGQRASLAAAYSLAIMVFCLFLALYLLEFSHLPPLLRSSLIFYVFITVAGGIGGMQFSAINKHYIDSGEDQTAHVGDIYGSDMVGSAIGALVTSLVFIPLYGIMNTLMALALINILAALFCLARRSC